jgi:hypothetical protein
MRSTKAAKIGPRAGAIGEVPGLQDAMVPQEPDVTETVLVRTAEGRQIVKEIFSALEEPVVKAAWATAVARVADRRASAGSLRRRCRN